MEVSIWVWLATVGGVLALLALSFFTHVRRPHAPSMREAGAWTAFFVCVSVLFGCGMGFIWNWDRGVEFFAGYITEYSLSVDNLFVFVIIMSSFAVPRPDQERVLMAGIVIALVLRTIFILLGGAAIAHFSWVFYIFGLFLIFTAAKLAFGKGPEEGPYKPNILVRAVRSVLPTTDYYDGVKLVTRVDGKAHLTPMLMVMLAIGMTDVLFALDSIPAIYGLTGVPYIVFAANAFALLGLIELYFLLGGLIHKLVYLGVGLALILAFIGVKLIIEAMHGNHLPFVNGGRPVHVIPEIPTWLSLAVIVGILAVTTIASLVKMQRERGATAGD